MNARRYKYDAFISYRHCEPDRIIAERLHKMLETYRVPRSIAKKAGRKKIGRVFRDREELPTSASLAHNIQDALENSEFLIVVCSPRTPQSQWVNKEIETFAALHGRDGILALLIEGEPSESFPEPLRFAKSKVDTGNGSFEERIEEVEPLAADIRAETLKGMYKKLKLEILRLLAPIFSCGFDDLRQRQRERTVKRVLTASISLSVFFLGFGSFSAYQAMQIKIQSDKVKEKSVLLENQVQKTLQGQSMYMANISNQLLAEGDRRTAVMVAREALPKDLENPERPYVEEAEYALSQALQVYKCDGRLVPDLALKHDKNVKFIKISPDGKTAVTAAEDGYLYIWDTSFGKLINKYNIKEKFLTEDRLFFIDDRTIVFPLGYSLVSLDTETLKVNWTYDRDPFNMAINADRTMIAFADVDGDVTALDTHTGEVLFNHALSDYYQNEETLSIYRTSMDASGKYFAAGLNTGDVLLFDLENKTYVGAARGKYATISDIAVTGGRLAIATDDFDINDVSAFTSLNGSLDVFDLADGIAPVMQKDFVSTLANLNFNPYNPDEIVFTRDEELDVLSLSDNAVAYAFVCGDVITDYSIKETFIITCSRDGTVRFMFMYESGYENANYRVQLQEGLEELQAGSGIIAVAPVSSDKAFILRNVRGGTYKELAGADDPINGCAFSPDGTGFLTYAFGSGEIVTWDWKKAVKTGSMTNAEELIFACYLDNDDKVLASYRGGTVTIYDSKTLEALSSHKFDYDVYYENLSPHRTFLCMDDADGTHVIRTSDFSTALTVSGNPVFFNDESKVIVLSPITQSEIIDTQTGSVLKILEDDGIQSLVVSDDGQSLACLLEDNTVHILDAESLKEIQVISDCEMPVDKLQFSPDGKSIFMGLDDNSIRLYDVKSGKVTAVLDGHSGVFSHAVFSPDVKLYITVDEDRTAILWKSGTNKKIGCINWFLGVSPDFGTLISTENKTLLLMPVYDTAMLAEEAEKQLGGATLTDMDKRELYIVN